MPSASSTNAPKFMSLVTGPSICEPTGNLLRDFEPGIGEGLLEAEGDAALFGGLMERMTASTRSPCLSRSLGWRTFFAQDISEM